MLTISLLIKRTKFVTDFKFKGFKKSIAIKKLYVIVSEIKTLKFSDGILKIYVFIAKMQKKPNSLKTVRALFSFSVLLN